MPLRLVTAHLYLRFLSEIASAPFLDGLKIIMIRFIVRLLVVILLCSL